MPAAVKSAFDIAFWFADRALADNEYLQPQKLQRLLFLSHAYYASISGGRKLMPAVFVADELGPVEPNVYLAFSKRRPDVDIDIFLPEDVEPVLMEIWRRFGRRSSDALTELTKETAAYREAARRGPRAEIAFEAMRRCFSQSDKPAGGRGLASRRLMRTQDGRPVQVKAWVPPARTAADGSDAA